MGNVVRPAVNPEWASAATTNNGANLTANKVEPTATHKSLGYSYPEQPARNHTNWWMNAVYLWIDYIDSWITKWGSLNKNFSMDDVNTGGLIFAYNAGKLSVAIFTELTAAAGNLTLSDGDGTYNIYFDCSDSTVKKLVGSIPVSNDTILPLYTVPVVAGAIDVDNIVDLRTFTTLRKASTAEVTAGTDKDKYVSPFTLQAFAVPSASDSVYGKVKLATAAEVLAQAANSVLTAVSLSYAEIRASISKYGTVRLADTSDLAARTGDDVLTVSHLADANARATASLYGVAKLADNTDLLLANRLNNTDVLTADSLTRTNMQAGVGRAGVAPLASQVMVDNGTDPVSIVTPATLRDGGYIRIFETAYQTYNGYGTAGGLTKSYNFFNPDGVAAGAIAFKDYKFFARCIVADGNYTPGLVIPLHEGVCSTIPAGGGATVQMGFTSYQFAGAGAFSDGVMLDVDLNHGVACHDLSANDGMFLANNRWEIKCIFYV